jgi:hypothetical protein
VFARIQDLFRFLLALLLGNVSTCRYLVNHISVDGAGLNLLNFILLSLKAGDIASGDSASNRSTESQPLHRFVPADALVECGQSAQTFDLSIAWEPSLLALQHFASKPATIRAI